MFEGLIPGPQRLAEILAALPPSPPAASAIERQADDQSFEDFLKISRHKALEESQVAELRGALERALGPRLEEELSARLLKRSLSKATTQRYAADLKRFSAFCREVGVSYLPAAPESFAAFLMITCGDEYPKPAMMARFCAAVRLRHQAAGLLDPTESVWVRAVRRLIDGAARNPENRVIELPEQEH